MIGTLISSLLEFYMAKSSSFTLINDQGGNHHTS
jgi:hypothetical protein